MKRAIPWAAAGLLVAAAVMTGASAQSQRVMIRGNYANTYRLLLPGAIVVFADDRDSGQVKVVARNNFQDPLPESLSAFDVEKDDVLVMADGNPIASTKDLEKLYDEADVGQEMSLGLQRGEDVLIATFAKPDPASLPQIRTVTRTGDGSQNEDVSVGEHQDGRAVVVKEPPDDDKSEKPKKKEKKQKPPPQA